MTNTVTEESAKKKWCPFNQVSACSDMSDSLEMASNRGQFEEYTRCLGSACMAWQWEEVKGVNSQTTGITTDKGYCGLARKS